MIYEYKPLRIFFCLPITCLCITHKVCHIAAERNDLSQVVISIESLGMCVVKMCSYLSPINSED